MSMSTERTMDWVLKITTALVIPILIWTFKLSSDVAILKDRAAAQATSTSSEILHTTATKAAVNETTIRGVKEKVDRISDTLDRIENYLRARSN